MRNIYEAVNQLLSFNDYSQEQLAKYLGVERSTISKWKHNTRYPNTEQFEKLCDLYGIDPFDLLSGKNVTPLKHSFRKNDDVDLEVIANINKIAVALEYMEELVDGKK